MQSYSTRQRKVLLTYLSQHPDELLSARQIADALAAVSYTHLTLPTICSV